MLYRIKFRVLTDEASEKFVFNIKARQEFALDKYFRPILSEDERPIFRLLVNGETFLKLCHEGYKHNGVATLDRFFVLKPGDHIVCATHSIEVQDCPIVLEKSKVTVLEYTRKFRFTDMQLKWLAGSFAFLFLLTHHQWGNFDTSESNLGKTRSPSSIRSNATQDIFLAIQINNISKFKRLMERNDGYLNHRDDAGKTPLMEASFLGRTEMIQLIDPKKTLLDLQDRQGNTALMWAIVNNQVAVVKQLINLGANTKLTRNDQMDALKIAQKRHENEIVALLLSDKKSSK